MTPSPDNCGRADATTALTPATWRELSDDGLTDPEVGPALDGYVWGVKWQALYPGARRVADSRRAQEWAERVGINFPEVRFEMNGRTRE